MSSGVEPLAYKQKGSTKRDLQGETNPAYANSSLGDISKPAEDEIETEWGEDENEERGNWTGRFDFFLSTLGLAVGLGNVWRFPYLCYRNGGGVFFIPYTMMLFLVGVPIFFLELSVGQFSSSSALTVWKLSPAFMGVGISMCIVSTLVAIYYNVIIGWSIYYMIASLTSELPWTHCDKSWTRCSDNLPDMYCNATLGEIRYDNGTCYNSNSTLLGIWNDTIAKNNSIKRTSASEEYFNRIATGVSYSSGLEDLGPVRWQNALCLAAAWVIVFFSLIKSIKSSGKVVYFTALFPYVVLIILLIRGVLLEGHLEGIKFYLTGAPDVSYTEILSDAKVWRDAASQIFFSLSTSWGGLIVLSSYNKFHNNCLRDAFLIAIGNCLTSFFAGFVIFSFIGYMAHVLQTDVDKVAASGVGLAFIVYPTAVTLMPVSPLWSFLFFFMLITLGLDSEFGLMETILTSIMDLFPRARPKKTWVMLGLCCFFYLLGLTMCTEGGVHMLGLLDTYSSGFAVLFIAIFEIIVIIYVYGVTITDYEDFPHIFGIKFGIFRFFDDIGTMIGTGTPCWKGRKWPFPWPYWAVMWMFITPGMCLFILFFSLVEFKGGEYGKDAPYEPWVSSLGLLVAITVIIPIAIFPIVMFLYYLLWNKSEVPIWRRMFKPHRNWGPALVRHRRLVDYVDDFVVDPDGTPDGLPMNIKGQSPPAYKNVVKGDDTRY